MKNKLLDKINYPSDLRELKKNQLEQLATEKIAADTAERKKAAFDWLREKKRYEA